MLITESLADQVERQLKDEIVSARISPGERIDVKAYAAAWNVSPTPVRDAVKQLEMQGFARISPRRGVFVAEIDGKVLKDVFDLRIVLECLAVELATPRIPPAEASRALDLYRRAQGAAKREERTAALREIDNLIHDTAIRFCGNPRLTRILLRLREVIRWSQNTVIRHLHEPYETTLPEHLRIAEAICARDVTGATRAMREHLENTFQRIQRHLDRQRSRRSPDRRRAKAASAR